jgi:hypothetical protein
MLGFEHTATLVLRTLEEFVLAIIPCMALAAFAAWRGIRDPIAVGLSGLLGIAAAGYAAFWLWFLSPRIGHAASFLLPIACLGWLWWVRRRLDGVARAALRSLARPAALVLCAAFSVLSAGFLYGGFEKPIETPWARFSHRLPPDNMLPFLLAEEVRIGHIYKPFFEGGQSSDRPPLQAGIALSQYPFWPRPRQMDYTALAVLLQSSWIFAAWLLLRALDFERRGIALALAVTFLSGFVFLNSFFVWPKLLAATFMIGFAIFVLVDRYAAAVACDPKSMILAGALLAFGMLAHGGSAFAAIGLLLAALVLRRRIPLKALATIAATAFLIYLPWTLYQKLFDPPGDYLLKLHLAGIDHPDNGSFFAELIAAYRALTPAQFASNKIANFLWAFDYQKEYWAFVRALFSATLSARWSNAGACALGLRSLSFFHFVPNLGFLSGGFLTLAAGLHKRSRSAAWRASARLWLCVMCILLPWCLMMFKAESTSIHQGTYVAVLLACCAAIAGFWAVKPWVAAGAAVLQIALNFLVYGAFMGWPGSSLIYSQLGLLIAAMGGVVLILGWEAKQDRLG